MLPSGQSTPNRDRKSPHGAARPRADGLDGAPWPVWPPLLALDSVRKRLASSPPSRELRWAALAELATIQHGVIASWQLQVVGFKPGAVARMIRARRLHPLHLGVYAVGHRAISPRGRLIAAALAGGPDTWMSHLAAAAAHGLRLAPRGPLDLITPQDRRCQRPGVRLHRAASLTPADVTVAHNVPTTSVARLLLDLARAGRGADLKETIARAQRKRVLDARAIADLVARSAGHRGVRLLRSETEEVLPYGGVPRNDYEAHVRDLLANHGIEPPIVNGLIRLEFETLQVDFHWPAARLVVEADSYEWHHDLEAFNEDRRRDQELKRQGWEVLRFTWQQLKREPARVARIVSEVLEARLAARSASGQSTPVGGIE